ncbi:MAG: LysM peptidoglycan-binding domain-containing protein [Planctomycetota bacterium]|nr:LysM peptidoglycan-binding domain-containing protein [Planctomycetota bacterium]
MVQPGDNLTTIARRHGVSLKSLMAANPQDDPNLILIGQRLLIPGI